MGLIRFIFTFKIGEMAIYMWREKRERHPNENTILYLPIDDNDSNTVYDHSWNGNNFSWYGSTNYSSTPSWWRCIYSGGNCIQRNWSLISSWPMTLNMRAYVYTYSWSRCLFFDAMDNFTDKKWVYIFDGDITYWDGSNMRTWSSYTYPKDAWQNIIRTFNWQTVKIYVNWVKVDEQTKSYDILYSDNPIVIFWWYAVNWGRAYFAYTKMSDIIIENREWTQTEAEDYFDQTKWDYWIN